jgi:hypothetical protein
MSEVVQREIVLNKSAMIKPGHSGRVEFKPQEVFRFMSARVDPNQADAFVVHQAILGRTLLFDHEEGIPIGQLNDRLLYRRGTTVPGIEMAFIVRNVSSEPRSLSMSIVGKAIDSDEKIDDAEEHSWRLRVSRDLRYAYEHMIDARSVLFQTPKDEFDLNRFLKILTSCQKIVNSAIQESLDHADQQDVSDEFITRVGSKFVKVRRSDD